jgi:dihydrofolate reductase
MHSGRQLVVTQNITVDGVIDAAGGWFDASGGEEGVDQTDVIEAVQKESDTSDAILLGRVTFEQMRGFWPLLESDPTGVRDHLNRVHKYVFSRTLESPGWEPATVLRGPVLEEVRSLKAQPGQDLICTGSMSLMPELVGSGLVDEYRLFVYPVVLGRGQRLFAEGTRKLGLRLVEARPFRSGLVLLRYRPEA